MKKNLILGLVFVSMLTAAVWFFISKPGSETSLTDRFAWPAIDQIDSIRIRRSGEQSMLLSKSAEGWSVNYRYPVRAQLLDYLLDAVKEVTVLAPAGKSARAQVMKEMAESSIKTEIYAGGKLVKTYYIGGPTLDNKGTYYVLEQNGKVEETPYIVYIPGFNGFLTSRFNSDPELWRSREFFAFGPEQTDTLTLLYPAETRKSFQIYRTGDSSFSIRPLDPAIDFKQAPPAERIAQYLEFYRSLAIETYDNAYSKRDSIVQTTPLCDILVRFRNGKTSRASIYYMPVNERSKTQYDDKGREVKADVDRLFVSMNNNADFGVLQYYVWGKVMRSYSEFYQKPVQQP
jgi:hypothetical protein